MISNLKNLIKGYELILFLLKIKVKSGYDTKRSMAEVEKVEKIIEHLKECLDLSLSISKSMVNARYGKDKVSER